jgi:hypothetical protein
MSLPASTSIRIQAAVGAARALVCLRLGAAGRRAPRAACTADTGTSATGDHHRAATAAEGLIALAYELLDAHADTAQLADGLTSDQSWAAHVDYLRALQRRGREVLARATTQEQSSCRRDDSGPLDVR